MATSTKSFLLRVCINLARNNYNNNKNDNNMNYATTQVSEYYIILGWVLCGPIDLSCECQRHPVFD